MIKDNFIKIFENRFKESWESAAIEDYITKKCYTYQQLAQTIHSFHKLFEHAQIEKGDKIAVCGKNCTSWIVAYMSAITYGAVVVPILDEFNPYDLKHILEHSNAKIFFVDKSLATKLEFKDFDNIKMVISLSDFSLLHSHENENIADRYIDIITPKDEEFTKDMVSYADKDNSELTAIYYTSGTVSLTKGVMLTGNNLAGNVKFALDTYLEEGKLKRSLVILPLAHAFGTAFDMLSHLAAGGKVTLLGKVPSPQILLKACQEVKPTLLFCVPLVLEKIYQSQIAPKISTPTMKILLKLPIISGMIYRKIGRKVYEALGATAGEVIVGGAALNPDVEAFFRKASFPFMVGYGMTECAPLISYSGHKDFVLTSVGKILSGLMEIKIAKENNTDAMGEILVRGEHVMQGYYKDEEATKNTFTEDGWLKTGDLGYIDDEGNIYIRGRAKTMILSSNGENIYPEAIESKLNNLPLISESLVLQVPGGKINAYIYPDYELAETLGVSKYRVNSVMRDNRQTVNMLLSRYERISRIVILDEPMPKTPKRTIKRYIAEQMIIEKREKGIIDG